MKTTTESEKRWLVYSTIDRGEGALPRFVGGYCHLWPVSREDSERIAANERLKSYVASVEIKEVIE